MTEEQEKGQSETTTDAEPRSHDEIRDQARQSQEEARTESGLQTPQPDQRMPTETERSAAAQDPDKPQDAPPGYEPQVELQPGQTGGIVERPGEQVSDVEAEQDDQLESDALDGDDDAVDAPEEGTPDSSGQAQDNPTPGESG